VVGRFLPQSLHVGGIHAAVDDDEGVAGEQIEERLPPVPRIVLHRPPSPSIPGRGGGWRGMEGDGGGWGNRQEGHLPHLSLRALRLQLEAADRDDLIAPPLDPGRPGHAEAVDVNDASAHGKLRHVQHRGTARESHGLESLRHRGGAGGVPPPEVKP
jgi:hypothetical protein